MVLQGGLNSHYNKILMFKYNNLIIYRLIILVTYLVTVYTNLLDRNVPF